MKNTLSILLLVYSFVTQVIKPTDFRGGGDSGYIADLLMGGGDSG